MARVTPDVQRARDRWLRAPRVRPAGALEPGPGQESVWDYPRPPRLEPVARIVRVEFADRVIAHSSAALRVCETSGPPTYYLPPGDVETALLEPGGSSTLCEWKGMARYASLRIGDRVSADAAWSYPDPFEEFEALRDFLAFYPGRVDACFVGEARVTPQPGDFYAGWVTPEIVGPFKGAPGTSDW